MEIVISIIVVLAVISFVALVKGRINRKTGGNTPSTGPNTTNPEIR